MSIEKLKTELAANQGEFRTAQSAMQTAGDEVEKIGDLASAVLDKVTDAERMLSPLEAALGQISASGQFATAKYTAAVEKLHALTGDAANIHAMVARHYGSVILEVLQGTADQNLPAELGQVTRHVQTVLQGLAMAAEGLAELRGAATVAEDTVALVAGPRQHTAGWIDVAPEGLTPGVLNETTAFIAEL